MGKVELEHLQPCPEAGADILSWFPLSCPNCARTWWYKPNMKLRAMPCCPHVEPPLEHWLRTADPCHQWWVLFAQAAPDRRPAAVLALVEDEE